MKRNRWVPYKILLWILNYTFGIKIFLRHHLRWLVCPILTWVFQQRFQNQALWKILLIRSSDWLEYRAVKVWKYFSAHGSNRKMVFRWLQLGCQSSIGTYGEKINLAKMGKPDVQHFQRGHTRILKKNANDKLTISENHWISRNHSPLILTSFCSLFSEINSRHLVLLLRNRRPYR